MERRWVYVRAGTRVGLVIHRPWNGADKRPFREDRLGLMRGTSVFPAKAQEIARMLCAQCVLGK